MPSKRGSEITSPAIILRSQTIGEDDILVDFLTPGLGRLWGRARHGRKSRKRFGTLLDTFNILKVRFQDSGRYVDLSEVSLEKPLTRLSGVLETLFSAFYVVDLVRELVPERNHEPRHFELLESKLLSLNQGADVGATVSEYEKEFLEIAGYAPQVDRCQGCDRPFGWSGGFYFVYCEGGVYCGDCLPAMLAHDTLTREAYPRILARFIEYQIGRLPRARKILTVCSL